MVASQPGALRVGLSFRVHFPGSLRVVPEKKGYLHTGTNGNLPWGWRPRYKPALFPTPFHNDNFYTPYHALATLLAYLLCVEYILSLCLYSCASFHVLKVSWSHFLFLQNSQKWTPNSIEKLPPWLLTKVSISPVYDR